jgi:hypothetical protein
MEVLLGHSMFLDVFEMKLQDIGIWICNRCGNMFFCNLYGNMFVRRIKHKHVLFANIGAAQYGQ